MKIRQFLCRHRGLIAVQREKNYINMTVTLECPECGMVREVKLFPTFLDCKCTFDPTVLVDVEIETEGEE